MRRFTIGMAVVLALSLMLAAVAVAVAAPADFCEVNPDHWKCTTTTSSTSTTTTTAPSTLQSCTDDVLKGITGTGRVGVECLWSPDDNGSLVGTVTVTPNQAISGLVVFVRDSSPGDICVLEQPGAADSPFVASFDLFYADLPDDSEWDPDDVYPDFAPYEGQSYWSFGGTHWCYPLDGVEGMREDLNGEPLHLNVGFIAKKDTAVDVTLFPVQEGTATP